MATPPGLADLREQVVDLLVRQMERRGLHVTVDLPALAAPPLSASASADRVAMVAALELASRLADRHPLVLVLDDMQWVDANTLALLADLTLLPLLIVRFRPLS